MKPSGFKGMCQKSFYESQTTKKHVHIHDVCFNEVLLHDKANLYIYVLLCIGFNIYNIYITYIHILHIL
jgi:hypothetical protein